MPQPFDPKLSLILDECIIRAEEGDESYKPIKATIEQAVLDDRHSGSTGKSEPKNPDRKQG
jgi:hypothetical protein